MAERSFIDLQRDSQSFDTVADLYDMYRPEYPQELVESAILLTGIPEGGRILEIGSGTGKATLPFAARGFCIHCIEPGPNLVAVASKKLQAYPNVTFERSRFEDWQVRPEAFDLVMAGSSFHWISKQAGFANTARALKPHGALALFWNTAMGIDGELAEDLEAVYRERVPEFNKPQRNREKLIQERYDDIAKSGLFGLVSLKRFPWSRTYQMREYLGLLNTYSDHLRLQPETRRFLFEGIAQAIDSRGGTITREYQSLLYTAKKRT